MRTTVDIPDDLFRKTKATAALRGTTMKELIVSAIRKSVEEESRKGQKAKKVDMAKLPVIRLKGNRKLDLSDFDFDELLG